MSDHPRNIVPMQNAPRCGAKTRSGTPCGSPAISGNARCRMHGGKGSGAPKANRNALRQGLYTKEVLAREAKLRDIRQRLAATIAAIEGTQKTS
jgi:glucans biosynthesis protein